MRILRHLRLAVLIGLHGRRHHVADQKFEAILQVMGR
jgi:hypothetical protein